MRQFVHSQDSSWRSLFRNSNFSAQCRIVSASRQICTVPHDLSDRPAYPLPVILPIPLLLNPGNGVAALTDAFIHQRLSASGASAPRHSRYCRKTIYSGRPSACHTRNGFDRVYRILQQLFSRLSTASQLPQPPGQKALPPPSARAKRSKTSFH